MHKGPFKKTKVGDSLYISVRKLNSEEFDYIKTMVNHVQHISDNLIHIESDEFSFNVVNTNDTNIVIRKDDCEYIIYTNNTEYVTNTRKWLQERIDDYGNRIERLIKQHHELIGNLEPLR